MCLAWSTLLCSPRLHLTYFYLNNVVGTQLVEYHNMLSFFCEISRLFAVEILINIYYRD
jgi:hypothetical protein